MWLNNASCVVLRVLRMIFCMIFLQSITLTCTSLTFNHQSRLLILEKKHIVIHLWADPMCMIYFDWNHIKIWTCMSDAWEYVFVNFWDLLTVFGRSFESVHHKKSSAAITDHLRGFVMISTISFWVKKISYALHYFEYFSTTRRSERTSTFPTHQKYFIMDPVVTMSTQKVNFDINLDDKRTLIRPLRKRIYETFCESRSSAHTNL